MPRFLYSIVCLVLTFVFLSSAAYAYTSPGTPTGYVNDFAGVMSQDKKDLLEGELSAFEKSTQHQVSVVTIKTLGEDDIETYANTLFREWGIGTKEHNNGVLFLVAVDDRKMRIEVGYGLEGAVTDSESSYILDETVRPAFKAGNYSDGIVEGSRLIMKAAAEEIVSSTPEVSAASSSSSGRVFSWLMTLLPIIGIGLLSWFASIFGKTKSFWLGGVVGGFGGAVMMLLFGGWGWIPAMAFMGLIFDLIVSTPGGGSGGGGSSWSSGSSSRSSWSSSSSSSSSSSGSSFGGFKGGSSGGGGASSSW